MSQFDETSHSKAEEYAKWLSANPQFQTSLKDSPATDFRTGRNSAKESLSILARALEKISKSKGYTRLADCCVDKTCHINSESGSCSFQTGVHYGNNDRAAESNEAIAALKALGDWPL